MAYFVLGTSGHVDHGKTTLIRALTGIDTDRLPEEKERGLSIDLGFAHMTLDDGTVLGIVDVPGHERFLSNMLAGVGGLDLALLLIDVVEGVKPQTVEHLEILQMLSLPAGIVLMNKIDLVDDEWVEETEKEVREFLEGTFLEKAAIIPVSALTGAGLPDVRRELTRLVATLPPRDAKSPARLPVDRIFIRPGFGTVVTGTLLQGKIRQGDRLELLPRGISARIRALQVHGEAVDEAEAGQRVGLNLSGMDSALISRGDVLAAPDFMKPTTVLDAKFDTLPDLKHVVKNRAPVRFYLDTAEVIGKLVILDRDELGPSMSAYVQIKLEEPVAALRGDRFVLRNFSALYTLGGGVIMDPLAQPHRRHDQDVLKGFEALESGKDDPFSAALEADGGRPHTAAELAGRLQVLEGELKERLDGLVKDGTLFFIPSTRTYILESQVAQRAQKVLEALERWHGEFPWRPGRRREEIFSMFPPYENKVAEELLARLLRDGSLKEWRNFMSLPGHLPRLSPEQQKTKERVMRTLEGSGFTPPSIDEIRASGGLEAKTVKFVEEHLLELGEVVKVAPGIYLLTARLEEAKSRIRKMVAAGKEITPANVRDALDTSRKFVIPIMEYLDNTKFTRRLGERRELVAH